MLPTRRTYLHLRHQRFLQADRLEHIQQQIDIAERRLQSRTGGVKPLGPDGEGDHVAQGGRVLADGDHPEEHAQPGHGLHSSQRDLMQGHHPLRRTSPQYLPPDELRPLGRIPVRSHAAFRASSSGFTASATAASVCTTPSNALTIRAR